jgi:uncharacterized protein (TIGR04255 family)
MVKGFLPGVGQTPPFGFGAPFGTPFGGGTAPGVLFQRTGEDGNPKWLLTAQQNFIQATCMDYSRWPDVWGRVHGWLEELYSRVKTSELSLFSISLHYLDNFLAELPIDPDAFAKMFNGESEYLPPRMRQNEALWHVNQGWYREVREPISGRQLTTINIGTQQPVGHAQLTLTIDHLMRYEVEDGSPPLFDRDGGEPLIVRVMENLHEQNKALFRSLLTREMQERINLA